VLRERGRCLRARRGGFHSPGAIAFSATAAADARRDERSRGYLRLGDRREKRIVAFIPPPEVSPSVAFERRPAFVARVDLVRITAAAANREADQDADATPNAGGAAFSLSAPKALVAMSSSRGARRTSGYRCPGGEPFEVRR
jgi:hypothetical protein